MKKFEVFQANWRDDDIREAVLHWQFKVTQANGQPAKLPWPKGYAQVAKVECVHIEDAYMLTNHLGNPWWCNAGVELVGNHQHRSTSVGDVIRDVEADVFWICAPAGWVELPKEG